MNKDQIMRAVENASPEQLEQIAAIVDTTPTQVPVTQRHVGCVVDLSDNCVAWDRNLLMEVQGGDLPFEGFNTYYRYARFPNPYRVPITHRWSGGKQPVENHILVLIEFRDHEYEMNAAAEFDWIHRDRMSDIIGYTVLDVIGVEDE